MRVKLNPTKPLTRFVPLTVEGSARMFLQVKYEKMPKHCEHCGLMGHTYLECGTGEHEVAERQFGLWMISDEAYWKRGTPGVRTRNLPHTESLGRGSTGARGGRMAGRTTSERGRRKWVPKGGSVGRKRNSA